MNTRIKKLYTSIEKNILDNEVYYITAGIMTLIFLLSLLISSCKPFGDAYPLFGDGILQNYPINSTIFQTVKEGQIFSYYNFSAAGFYSTYAITLSLLTHPWIILRNLIFPDSCAIFFSVIDVFIYYIFASLSIIFYLTHKTNNKIEKHDKRLIAIGLIYGLSNYALAFYCYRSFMYLQLLPILILGLEHLVYKKKPVLYTCILILFMLDDSYHAFILCEFLALYFLTMDHSSVLDFIKNGIRFAISSIVSALLTTVVLIPNYMLFISESSYQEADSKVPSPFKFFTSYIDLLSYYRIGNNYNSVSEYNYQAGIYCGLIILAFIPTYIMCKQINLKDKIGKLAILILLFLSFNNELLNYVFHGFHYQSMVPNRNAAFFVFMICIIFSDCLLYIDDISSRKLFYSILGLCTLMTIIYINTLNLYKGTNILALIFILLYAGITTTYLFIQKKNTRVLTNVLLYVTIIELIINSIINFAQILSGSPTIVTMSKSIDNIVSENEDMSKFYNTTNLIGDHDILFNIGFSSKINSTSFFASGFTYETLQRTNTYNIKTSLNSCNYKNGNPLADMMLHVKYQIKYAYDDTAYSIYDKISQYNEYTVYENPYVLGFGFSIPNVSSTDERINPNQYGAFYYQNTICNYLGGQNIYDIIELKEYNPNDDNTLDQNQSLFTYGESYESVNLNTTTGKYRQVYIHLKDDINGYIYADVDTGLYCVGKADEQNHDFTIDYPVEAIDKDFTPSIAILNEKNLMALHDKLKPSELQNLSNNGRQITGDFKATENGALYISIPYYKGWTIYLDGKEVEKHNYLGGMGIDVPAGEHKLEMKYTPPGMYLGIIISVSTLLLLIINSIIKSKFKEKKNK